MRMILHCCKACGGFILISLGEIFCWIMFVFCFGQCAYRQCVANPMGTTCGLSMEQICTSFIMSLRFWSTSWRRPTPALLCLGDCPMFIGLWMIFLFLTFQALRVSQTWTKTHNKIKWVGGWWFLVATAAAAVASLLLSLCLLNLIAANFLPFVLVLHMEHSWKNNWMVHRNAYWNDCLVSSLLIVLLSEKTQPALCLLLVRWTQVSDFPGLFFLVRADWRIQGSLYKDKSK